MPLAFSGQAGHAASIQPAAVSPGAKPSPGGAAAGRGRPAVAVDPPRVLGEGGPPRVDPAGRDVPEYETLVGELDGRVEETSPLQLAVILREPFPGVQVARRGNGPGATPVVYKVWRRLAKHARVQRF